MQETYISPQSGLTALRDGFKSLRSNAKMTRELATRMFLRDIRAMYRQSILGYAWILLPPLANSLVWIYLNQQQVVTIDTGDVPYPIFVLAGNLLWMAFNVMLTGMLTSVSSASSVIAKVHFPHEALLLSAFGMAAVNAVIPFVLLIPILPFFVKSFSLTMLLFPLGVFLIMLLACAIAILLIPLATLFTDVSRSVQFGLRFLFFMTPVVYPVPKEGIAKVICDLNPISPLLVTSRSWLIGEGPIMLDSLLYVSLAIPVLLLIGLIAFKIAIPFLVERLAS